MGYNEIKCQVCGEVLNENSMFGWVKGDKFNPINIYEVLKDIRNPLNLKCSILYCNDCAGKVDKVMFSVLIRVYQIIIYLDWWRIRGYLSILRRMRIMDCLRII